MNDSPIGVYDSGFGGLSVWREIHRALPEESLVYLGDGRNCPYGSLPEERIRELAEKAVRVLIGRGCKLIVVACNTATSAAIGHLRSMFPDVPFVGLEPAVKPACERTQTGVVGVIATERSLAGAKFLSTLARYGSGVRVVKAVGHGFVEAVESDAEDAPATEAAVRAVVDPVIAEGADVVVLGCTHYPFLRDAIRRVVGGRPVEIIDSGEAVEKRVESLLGEYDMRASGASTPVFEFLTFADDAYRERLRRKAFGI